MGIVNVTPDSFYDGGVHDDIDSAVSHARMLIDQGADILDIGGESTRPGSEPVSREEEIDRTVPVIKKIRAESTIPISIDTTKAAVAREALAAGADWVNDISAGRFDSAMASVVAQAGCPVILMHSRKSPSDMQNKPYYQNVVKEVQSELLESVAVFERAGVRRGNIIIDPGIGFAKRLEDNCTLLKHIQELSSMGFSVLVGTSRKSFIGTITGKKAADRLAGSLATVAASFYRGARFFRVHDVDQTRDLLKVIVSIEQST